MYSLPSATKLRQGNVFTHVCDSVHRGVSVSACTTGHMIRVSVWGSLSMGFCPGWSLSMGVSIQGGLCPGGLCSGGFLSRGGFCPEEVSVRGISVWGISVQCVSVRENPRQRPCHTVMSGRYASNWNAFLFQMYRCPKPTLCMRVQFK